MIVPSSSVPISILSLQEVCILINFFKRFSYFISVFYIFAAFKFLLFSISFFLCLYIFSPLFSYTTPPVDFFCNIFLYASFFIFLTLFINVFLNVMLLEPMERFQLELKLELPLFSGFTVVPFNYLCSFL